MGQNVKAEFHLVLEASSPNTYEMVAFVVYPKELFLKVNRLVISANWTSGEGWYSDSSGYLRGGEEDMKER